MLDFSAGTWRQVQLSLTAMWILLIIPSLLFWSQSITWVVFMSVWANVAGHFSAWQAARAEDKIVED